MKYIFKILIFALIIASLSCSNGHREEPGGYVIPEFYHSPEEINEFLDETFAAYPDITRVVRIGDSVSGREIKAIIISGDPVEPGSKPRIRLTGGIHGSEIISAEIMVYFIRYLVENYDADDADNEITALIDSRYIAIIPVLNPDGLAVAGRRNDNGVDLNRNFSVEWAPGSTHGDEPFSEPETQAFREYSLEENFHLSLTFHSGAVLVNIPFDYGKEIDEVVPAENKLVREFAFAYSKAGTFLDNPDLFDPWRLEYGIINGGSWYVITGSLQDWSYLETGCLDLTVEVAKRSPRTIEGVEQVFAYNRDSIIAYIKKGGQGVYGRVLNSSGIGVDSAQVRVTHKNGGVYQEDIIVCTDAEGFFHRILLPGIYTIVFQKDGSSATRPDITVDLNQGYDLENVILTP